MRYVILRDDDTSALTPAHCLERLYRPFLERGLPVNLSVIPCVRTDAIRPDGRPEQFLGSKNGHGGLRLPIGKNEELAEYLLCNPGFHITQHGFDHSLFEFDSGNANDICGRLAKGTQLLVDAGFPQPRSFVAPYDRFSRTSLREAARQFRVISSGWYELSRLPQSWWPRYAIKKCLRHPHWRVDGTILLGHPGCLLSRQRPVATMLDQVKKFVSSRRLAVLVTHWWEYFDGDAPNEPFIQVLHETASWLANQSDVRVIAFNAVARSAVLLN